MYLVNIGEVKPNEDNEAVIHKVHTSRKTHFISLEDAIVYVKQLVEKEPAPPLTFFKVHGNGTVIHTDSFGNPLPIKDWTKFAPALCEAKGWVYIPENMAF